MYCMFTGGSVERGSQMQLSVVRIRIVSVRGGNRVAGERNMRRIRSCQKKFFFLFYIYPTCGSLVIRIQAYLPAQLHGKSMTLSKRCWTRPVGSRSSVSTQALIPDFFSAISIIVFYHYSPFCRLYK